MLATTHLIVPPLSSPLEYGQAYPDIGTFQTANGSWSFWVGWDANFSETYDPEGEAYAWVVYFAPEAVYLALQSSKSLYSGVNVNAGYKYFFGTLNMAGNTRMSEALLGTLASVGLSRNLFSSSLPGIGFGAFSPTNLSFALSAGLTFIKEKSTSTLKRGVQIDSGISVSYDLISLPLPFSVSLGIDCESGDPPELCQFHGFYPILIYDLEPPTTNNPLDQLIEEFEKISISPPLSVEKATVKQLLEILRLMRTHPSFHEFIAANAQDSHFDDLISEVQQWLNDGDTSELPGNLDLPDPAEAHLTMKPIFPTAQMAFELGYQRGCRSNPSCTTIYTDCVVEDYCAPGEECVIEILAEDIAASIPGKTAAEFEGAWLLIDNSVEQYLVSGSETTQWLQIENGKAIYRFYHNSTTPVVLGVKIDPTWAPVDTWVELCRRLVLFSSRPGDINGDNNVDLADIIVTLQIVVGSDLPSVIDRGAELDDDDRIGLVEAIYILQIISSP